jgi:hypothetical protein
MGTHVAKDALHHQTDGPFWDLYSCDTQNFDFVPLRLGEVAGTKESALGEKIAVLDHLSIMNNLVTSSLGKLSSTRLP